MHLAGEAYWVWVEANVDWIVEVAYFNEEYDILFVTMCSDCSGSAVPEELPIAG